MELWLPWKDLAFVCGLGFYVSQFLLLCVGIILVEGIVRIRNKMKKHLEQCAWKDHLFISFWQGLLAMKKQCTVIFYPFSIFRRMKGSIKRNFEVNQRLIF